MSRWRALAHSVAAGQAHAGRSEPRSGAVTCIQNSRKRPTREFGGLPAMIAALMAPIDIPAIQVRMDASLAQCLIDTGLIGAKCTTALQHQRDNFEGKMICRRCNIRLNLSIHGTYVLRSGWGPKS